MCQMMMMPYATFCEPVDFLRSCRVAVSYGGRLRRRREGTYLWLRLGLCGREPRLRALCAWFPLHLGKLDPTPTLFSLSLCSCMPCRLTLAQGFSALGPTARELPSSTCHACSTRKAQVCTNFLAGHVLTATSTTSSLSLRLDPTGREFPSPFVTVFDVPVARMRASGIHSTNTVCQKNLGLL